MKLKEAQFLPSRIFWTAIFITIVGLLFIFVMPIGILIAEEE